MGTSHGDAGNAPKNEWDDTERDDAPVPGKQAPGAAPTDPVKAPGRPDPRAGIDSEVGDLEDPDAVERDGALPGRVGGGLAGG